MTTAAIIVTAYQLFESVMMTVLAFLSDESFLTLSDAVDLADVAQKIAAFLAILVGGGWAYFKFIKGRTFKKRLELTLSEEQLRKEGIVFLNVEVMAKNIGASRFKFDSQLCAVVLSKHTAHTPIPGAVRRAEWSQFPPAYPVFSQSSESSQSPSLEPGETAGRHLLIELQESEFIALQIELSIFRDRNLLRRRLEQSERWPQMRQRRPWIWLEQRQSWMWYTNAIVNLSSVEDNEAVL